MLKHAQLQSVKAWMSDPAHGALSLHVRIQRAIRQLILDGALPVGKSLPASRPFESFPRSAWECSLRRSSVHLSATARWKPRGDAERRGLATTLERGSHQTVRQLQSPLSGGRVESLRKGLSDMDAARAAMGQGWPFAACPWSNDGMREPRRRRGRMQGRRPFGSFWRGRPAGRLPKGTRRARRNL